MYILLGNSVDGCSSSAKYIEYFETIVNSFLLQDVSSSTVIIIPVTFHKIKNSKLSGETGTLASHTHIFNKVLAGDLKICIQIGQDA